MRSTYEEASVRLYHLDSEGDLASGGGGANTLFYGPMAQAVRIAEAQPAHIQDGLFLATDNDVVAWSDLKEGEEE